MDASTNPRHNQLLAALPHDQWQRWLSHLEHVDMPLGQVLYEPGDTLSHVYFPTTAIVSLLPADAVLQFGGVFPGAQRAYSFAPATDLKENAVYEFTA